MPAKGATPRATATFMLDLYDAHDDCRTKLGSVRKLVKTAL